MYKHIDIDIYSVPEQNASAQQAVAEYISISICVYIYKCICMFIYIYACMYIMKSSMQALSRRQQ